MVMFHNMKGQFIMESIYDYCSNKVQSTIENDINILNSNINRVSNVDFEKQCMAISDDITFSLRLHLINMQLAQELQTHIDELKNIHNSELRKEHIDLDRWKSKIEERKNKDDLSKTVELLGKVL